MTDHPLTNDLAEDIASTKLQSPFGIGELVFTHNDMRAAYDKGAADTLERVIKWLNVAIYEKSIDCYIDIASLPEELAKAMRPQGQL